MSQFPQTFNQQPQQNFQPQFGAPNSPQQNNPQQNNQQQPAQQNVPPWAFKALGDIQAGHFPNVNDLSVVGQVQPSHTSPDGFKIIQGKSGGSGLQINLKVEREWMAKGVPKKSGFTLMASIWGQKVHQIASQLSVGTVLAVRGQLQTYSFDGDNGAKITIPQIRIDDNQADGFTVLTHLPYNESRPSYQQSPQGGYQNNQNNQQQPPQQGYQPPANQQPQLGQLQPGQAPGQAPGNNAAQPPQFGGQPGYGQQPQQPGPSPQTQSHPNYGQQPAQGYQPPVYGQTQQTQQPQFGQPQQHQPANQYPGQPQQGIQPNPQ